MPRLLFLVLALFCTTAASLAKADWLHARSEHFEVFSSTGKGETREMVSQLEDMYFLFGQLYSQRPAFELHTLVMYFDSAREMKPYRRIYQGKPIEVDAIFVEPIDYPALIIQNGWTGDSSRRMVYNGMAMVMVNALVADAPLWFSTGFASLFETVEVDKSSFTFGIHHEQHVRTMQNRTLVPLSTLLVTTTNSPIYNQGDKRDLFYAESWAFVHMCMFGGDKSYAEKLKNYILAEGAESDKVACMERIFGEPMKSLDRRLSNYVQNGRYRRLEGKMPPLRETKVEFLPCSPVELAAAQTGLLQRIHQEERYKNDAVDAYRLLADTDNEQLCAMASLQCEVMHEEELGGTLAERAIALNTKNPKVYLRSVQYQTRQMPRTVSYRMPEEVAAGLRARIDKGLELYPDCLELYKQLAYVEAFAPTLRVEKMKVLQGIANKVADRDEILVMLAYMRWRYNDAETAKTILAKVKEERGLTSTLSRELDAYLSQGKPWKKYL